MNRNHVLLFSLLLIVPPCIPRRTDLPVFRSSFTVGHRRPDDEVVQNELEQFRGAPDYVYNYNKIYVGDNERVITQIFVEDVAEIIGSHAAIVAGGPGQTFVTVGYTVPRYVNMMFNVTVFGKTPAFRKIP